MEIASGAPYYLASGELGELFFCMDPRDIPAGLWISGNRELLGPGVIRIAIVGARRATPYGISVGDKLAFALASRGVAVVSGLAYGVDAAAHQGAIGAGGATIAVLGTGIDVVYPRAHERLQTKDIPKSGLVVSEFAPGTPSLGHHFPQRNRIIAALSHAIIVVEGDVDSGALITARWGARLGKEVLAVPGGIFSMMSRGPNQLIKAGAIPLTAIGDLFEDIPVLRSLAKGPNDIPGDPGSELDPSCKKILEFLASEPLSFDVLIERTGLEVSGLNQGLLELEMKGLISSGPYGYARN